MSRFSVLVNGKTKVSLLPGMSPEDKRHPLTGAELFHLKLPTATLLVDIFNGHGYSIAIQHLSVQEKISLRIMDELPPVAFHLPLLNELSFTADSSSTFRLKNQQCNLFGSFSLPFNFPASTHLYQFVSIYFNDDFLSPYAAHCPILQKFLLANNNGGYTALLEKPIFCSADGIQIINRILAYQQAPALAGNYYASLLHVFLIALVGQLNLTQNTGDSNSWELEKAARVREIILGDFEIYHTVEALAKKVRLSKMKLQLAFKQLYGTTVIHFSRDARLERGYTLLCTTDYPIRVICMMVGYDDACNFSCAFKKKYGYWPGYIRKSSRA